MLNLTVLSLQRSTCAMQFFLLRKKKYSYLPRKHGCCQTATVHLCARNRHRSPAYSSTSSSTTQPHNFQPAAICFTLESSPFAARTSFRGPVTGAIGEITFRMLTHFPLSEGTHAIDAQARSSCMHEMRYSGPRGRCIS